ncbi:alpha,alpha-trehalose-phosphate synthase (UDP-forming) [Kineococcus sp. SYSU DK005]|uniref:alpha,alpha-trehalose-phosphate synthase (UDP-forming) n=1 Tax=Kineococcus sp. SYSU DK005 TaxID=3383126 RepID=UPI003D7F0E1E
MPGDYDLVVVANRLPVDRVEEADGSSSWRRSPGGLVTALEPVMKREDGAWVGWAGSAGEAPEPFDAEGVRCVPIPLSEQEVEEYYEGFSNGTLWPLYHDVIVAPGYHRSWWDAYVRVNERFAEAAAEQAAQGATVWVQDYQLQLVPRMLRRRRPDLQIGFFNHIPFPPFEIFAQLPWRKAIIDGLLGADLVGFQRPADASNFARACRRASNLPARSGRIRLDAEGGREVRAASFPISIDFRALDELAQREDVKARAAEIRRDLGDPEHLLLGIDRLDYTKGILHRLKAFEELLDDGRISAGEAALVQVATPSRERVEQYVQLRQDVEVTVGRVNGTHSTIAHTAVHYLHHSYGREEMAALYLAADVMLVTALRDGMNLVAKEYVASRHDERGVLVLSEFTGAADELGGQALMVNPHDIDGLKEAVLRALRMPPREAGRRMRALRRRVGDHDVQRWAASFLEALAEHAPDPRGTAAEVAASAERSA